MWVALMRRSSGVGGGQDHSITPLTVSLSPPPSPPSPFTLFSPCPLVAHLNGEEQLKPMRRASSTPRARGLWC
jgi:hypothetical protein